MSEITTQKILLAVLMCAVLPSCTAIKYPQATGGSRADGIIKMSYQVGPWEKPDVQWGDAQQTSTARCKVWGYKSAEMFGGATTQCQAANGYGDCVSTLVTVEYQCTGAPTPSK
jgi:hypothetical protein